MRLFRRRHVVLSVRPTRNYRAWFAFLLAVVGLVTALSNGWQLTTSVIGGTFLGMVVYGLSRRR